MLFFIDFETTYTPRTPRGEAPHGLTHQSVPEYLHDPRTQILGAAVAVGNQPPVWRNPDQFRAVITQAVRHPAFTFCAHNVAFDLAVLARFFPDAYRTLCQQGQKYNDTLRRTFCTQAYARWLSSQGHLPPHVGPSIAALGEHFGLAKGDTASAVAAGGQILADYATRDVQIAQELIRRYPPRDHGWDDMPESRLSSVHDWLAVPHPHTLCVDADILRPLATETDADRQAATLLRRDAVFARALERLGVTPEYKTTATGREKLALAKGDSFRSRLLAHDNPDVRRLAEMRTAAASNIDRTRAQSLLAASDGGTRTLPLSIRYFAAHTGRSGGSGGLNPQNLPRGGAHRRALVAPPGYRLVAADASQIEVRVLSWLAGDAEMLDVFRRGADPYKAFAVTLYNLASEDEVTRDQRQVAKSAVLGLGFGAGPTGFLRYCETMGVEMDADTAEWVVRTYRQSRRPVTAYWRRLQRDATQGYLPLPSGRRLTYPDYDGESFLRPAPFARVAGQRDHTFGGRFCENVVQAVARDVTLATHAVRIARRVALPVLLVHDEIVVSVPEADADAALTEMLDIMRTPPDWAEGLPLDAEGHIATSYLECK